jgi:glycosidase
MISDLWYKNAVIYSLSVATFMDANGDGVGDFAGLMRRLDYLHGLGVTAIWLMPFQASPCRDDGYDISNYYDVDARYGTLGDFVEFTHAAEQRGIRVIIDLVVNHTSDQHAWFKAARRDPKSHYRDWYVWSKKKPRDSNKGMVFPGVQMAGDRMHMMFNFQANQNLFYALAASDVRPLQKALKATRPRPKTAQWGMFLRNHDELDLGRLSQQERQTVFKAFGPESDMQLYDRGIRRRLAPMLDGDRRRIELAYSLMFTLPGTPVLRYGDELGMGDDLRLPERQCARTPMQWSDEPCAGFTKSSKPILPLVSSGPFGYEHVNAARQRRDPDSMLNWTERIIRMRKEVPEVGWGDFEMIATRDVSVLAIRYDWRNNSVLFVHNLASSPREVSFTVGLKGQEGQLLVNLLSEDHSRADGRGKHRLLLEAYGYRWYRVGGLDYLLKRSDVAT